MECLPTSLNTPIMETSILYIGDPWLTTSSLTPLAVFTDEEAQAAYIRDLYDKEIISEYGYKCLTGYYGDNNTQAEVKNGQILLTSIPLNPTTSEF